MKEKNYYEEELYRKPYNINKKDKYIVIAIFIAIICLGCLAAYFFPRREEVSTNVSTLNFEKINEEKIAKGDIDYAIDLLIAAQNEFSISLMEREVNHSKDGIQDLNDLIEYISRVIENIPEEGNEELIRDFTELMNDYKTLEKEAEEDLKEAEEQLKKEKDFQKK